ncbi:MAG: hypothetical protein ACI9FN_003194 [Saprospiraceae bacterium]|jgi:hypothetical protein
MSWSNYSRGVTQITIGCIVWAVGITWSENDVVSKWTYFISIISYCIFCTCMYVLATQMIVQDKNYSFNGVISISFLFKLLMSLGILFYVETTFSPVGNAHILHYILIYIVYTIYETYFLTKIGSA